WLSFSSFPSSSSVCLVIYHFIIYCHHFDQHFVHEIVSHLLTSATLAKTLLHNHPSYRLMNITSLCSCLSLTLSLSPPDRTNVRAIILFYNLIRDYLFCAKFDSIQIVCHHCDFTHINQSSKCPYQLVLKYYNAMDQL